MKETIMVGPREKMNVGNEMISVPEWIDHLKERKDIVEMDYGYTGRFMSCKCKTKDGLHFVFRDCDEMTLTTNINMNFFMDTTHRLAKVGFTHFYEHMMFKRVKLKGKYLKSETLNKKAAENGIKLNAFTGAEGIVVNTLLFPKELLRRKTNYIEEAAAYRKLLSTKAKPKNPFEDVQLLFDMVYGLAYDHKFVEEDLEAEKKVVQSEIAMNKDDNWALYVGSQSVVLGDDFYDFLGRAEDIEKITTQDCTDLSNIFIDGCTDPATRHVLTGNFRDIPEVIDMWIDTISKVMDKKEKLLDYEDFDRTHDVTFRKLGNTKVKVNGLEKRKGKKLVVEVPNAKSSEINIYTEIDFSDKKWSKYNLMRTRVLLSTLINSMTGDLASPIFKIFREQLGWTYRVGRVQRPLSIGKDKYIVGWDMILGDHVAPTMETLDKAKEVLENLELDESVVKFLINHRTDAILASIDRMVYNGMDMPYADTLPMSEWNEFLMTLNDVKLEEWQYIWKTLIDSMYYIMLHGTEEQSNEEIDNV